jgi:hypothetical protein
MEETDPLPRPPATARAFFNVRRASRTISRFYDLALRPLEQEGLIRVSPEGYRRARMVVITDDGRATWRRAIGQHLGAERSAELRSLLAEATALDEPRASGA